MARDNRGDAARSMAAAPLQQQAEPVAEAQPVAEQKVEPVQQQGQSGQYARVPYRLIGFKLDVQRAYVGDAPKGTPDTQAYDTTRTQRVAAVILALRTEAGIPPHYIFGTVTHVTPIRCKGAEVATTGKPGWRISLPSMRKAGGSYFEGVIHCDDDAAKAETRAFLSTGPVYQAFVAWLADHKEDVRTQMQSVGKGGRLASNIIEDESADLL